ncbi:MAG: restriction endonuclease [Candidatus Bathyarchaeota archaeon]|nr:MAG: restriction endonuclease [Candidatus Bathyarchaeota archaeon]
MDPITANLLEKTEMLMELRGYQGKEFTSDEALFDVTAILPESNDLVLLRIVAKSNLKSNIVGVDKVRELVEYLQHQNFAKAILVGRRFTRAAKEKLKEKDIEFISLKRDIVPFITIDGLYLKIRGLIDALCEIKCERVPQTEDECQGFSKEPTQCSFCNGSGVVEKSSWNQQCPVCGGTGLIQHRYSCDVRLLSDNVDFHLERGWINLLQNDLLSLLKLMRTYKQESNDSSPFAQLLKNDTQVSS